MTMSCASTWISAPSRPEGNTAAIVGLATGQVVKQPTSGYPSVIDRMKSPFSIPGLSALSATILRPRRIEREERIEVDERIERHRRPRIAGVVHAIALAVELIGVGEMRAAVTRIVDAVAVLVVADRIQAA